MPDRRMKVKIGNNYSEKQNIRSSILQGSIQEFWLFLIFLNDLPNDIKSEIKLFVDEVKLVFRP